jgi:hypothetical protein
MTGFTYVVAPNMPLVKTRPNKINLESIQGLLEQGEKLLSWGTLPRSTYFGFDEQLVRRIFIGLGGASLLACLAQAPAMSDLIGQLCPPVYCPFVFLFGMAVWIAWDILRPASYVLTDRRVMRIDTFVRSFNLSAFERADLHIDDNGTVFIELWTKDSHGPNVVLEVGGDPQEVTAMFPLAVWYVEDAPMPHVEPTPYPRDPLELIFPPPEDRD